MGLYKTKFKRNGKPYTSPNWRAKFKHPETGDWICFATGTGDRQAAQTMLADRVREAALEKAGLANPFDDHHKRALREHVDDWRASLIAKGDTETHVVQAVRRVRAIVNACRFTSWPDISASAVQVFVGNLRNVGTKRAPGGVGAKTRNDHLGSFRHFCRWMVEDRRAASSPVAHLKNENTKTDRRRQRRALEHDELRRLIVTTRAAPRRFGMTGVDRSVLYQLGVESGLRRNEIGTLIWRRLDLDGSPPTVTVAAGYSKRRREDTLPLKPSTAAMLARWRDGRDGTGPDDLVFPKCRGMTRMSDMLQDDLEDTGIPFEDDAGRIVDFHALRHTFISNLARSGVHPKLAQDLARHADINLTLSVYSHTVIGEQAAAVEGLPDLGGSESQAVDVA